MANDVVGLQVSPIKPVNEVDHIVIRFAGDSGDGVQTIGDQLGLSSALAGNDISTLPDFPAEIRAPAGTVFGVSGFQLQFGSQDTITAGDQPDVLVAFNPAALKKNLPDLPKGGLIIVDGSNFSDRNLKLVGYDRNPIEDGSLGDYHVHDIKMTDLTVETLRPLGVTGKAAKRCSNFFSLGLIFWLYSRPLESALKSITEKFGKKAPEIASANIAVLKAGYHYGETAEAFQSRYVVPPHLGIPPGLYRSITGTESLAMGLVTAAHKSGLPLLYAGYPITPASDMLHYLSGLKAMGVTTIQAEDEIAACGMALGGAYAGALSVTASSGPGIALKGEFIGLANAIELPLVIVNVQRGGPATGLPTKMEQSDLLMAMFGRHGESPIPIVACRSPSDAFAAAFEAARIALTHMTPVMLLSDGNIAFGAEPWRIPDEDEFPAIETRFHTNSEGFQPYARDLETLARPWAVPGTPGCEHRVTGLERANGSGNISYDPGNHQLMTDLRAAKVAKIADSFPPCEVHGDSSGKLLVMSWGSPYGPVSTAVQRGRLLGRSVSHLHLRHLNPFPNDLGDILRRFERVLIPENNCGQLSLLIRAKYMVDARGFNQVRGLPFKIRDIEAAIAEELEAVL